MYFSRLSVRVLVKPGKIKSRNARKYKYSEEASKSNDVRKLIPHRLLGESSRGYSAHVLQVLTGLIPQKSWKGIKNKQDGTKRVAKVTQGTSQNILWGNEPNLQKHPVRK